MGTIKLKICASAGMNRKLSVFFFLLAVWLCAPDGFAQNNLTPITDRETIRKAQSLLYELGYFDSLDFPDGILGQKTRAAIEEFEADRREIYNQFPALGGIVSTLLIEKLEDHTRSLIEGFYDKDFDNYVWGAVAASLDGWAVTVDQRPSRKEAVAFVADACKERHGATSTCAYKDVSWGDFSIFSLFVFEAGALHCESGKNRYIVVGSAPAVGDTAGFLSYLFETTSDRNERFSDAFAETDCRVVTTMFPRGEEVRLARQCWIDGEDGTIEPCNIGLDSGLLSDGEKWGIFYTKGLIYKKQRLFSRSLESFEFALDLDDTDYRVYADLASLYSYGLDDIDKGFEVLDRGIDSADQSWRLVFAKIRMQNCIFADADSALEGMISTAKALDFGEMSRFKSDLEDKELIPSDDGDGYTPAVERALERIIGERLDCPE